MRHFVNNSHQRKDLFHVTALRRYAVKSMGGESLDVVELDGRGMAGDRWFAVEDQDGHFASGKRTHRFRRHDEVFEYRASTRDDGQVTVQGARGEWLVGERALDIELSRAMGLSVRVTAEKDIPHQDAGAVSLIGTATLRWCAAHLGVDADQRRLRVNIVVESAEPFIEETWIGQTISMGSAELDVVAAAVRCRMIDVAQDGAAADRRWLKPLAQQRGMTLAVYADVAAPGVLRVGDLVRGPRSYDVPGIR